MTHLVKTICVNPDILKKNVHQLLIEKIKNAYEKKTTKEDGYITHVYDDHFKIIDNIISSSCEKEIIFKVKFKADTIKPIAGLIIKVKVFIIEERAICTTYDQKINVLIPSAKLKGILTFNKQKNVFENVEKKICIKVGDIIDVEITNLKFEKIFNCIGMIIFNS